MKPINFLVCAIVALSALFYAPNGLAQGAMGLEQQSTSSFWYAGLSTASGNGVGGPYELFNWETSDSEASRTGDSRFEVFKELGYKGKKEDLTMVASLDFLSSLGWVYVDTQFYPKVQGVSMQRLLFRKAK